MAHAYAMATCLSNICRELDVDIVRGWNIDQDYTWAKTGHFKIAARSCDLVKETKLVKLLQLNKKNWLFRRTASAPCGYSQGKK